MSNETADVIVKFVKDKETKTKFRYTATGDISGSIYVDKDSELVKQLADNAGEIWLGIQKLGGEG